MKLLKEIWEYRTMIISLVKRDLRGRYKGSVLGFFWTFLNPLFQMLVYTFVFSVIMRAGIEDYYLFLFVALVPWTYFSTCVSGGAGCIIGQKDMIQKIYFPREVLPISYVLSQLINMLLTFIVVIIVLVISGKGLRLSVWWSLPIIIFVETILSFGFTMLFSALTVYFRDLQYVLGIITMAWQFCCPIMYSIDLVPERLLSLYYLNPMTPVIVAYRDIFYYKQNPQLDTMLSATVMGILFMIVGCFAFEKLKKRFAEVM